MILSFSIKLYNLWLPQICDQNILVIVMSTHNTSLIHYILPDQAQIKNVT